MAAVSFALGFKSIELRDMDLPIEIRKHDSTIVARTLASKPVDVRPGRYYAIARLPGGQRLFETFEMSDQPLTVTLSPDPEEESAHAWEETSHYLQASRSTARVQGPSILSREARAAGDAAPVNARFRLFAGNPIRGDVHVEPALSHLSIGHFERGRIVQFIVRGHDVPLFAQLVEPGSSVHNMAIPAAPFGQAELVFTKRVDGTCRMEVHLRNKTADMLLKYSDSGALSDAEETSQSTLLDAEHLLAEKGSDPVAAAAAACAILRFGQLKWLHDWTAKLDARFTWLPDGAAIHGEHLARRGQHAEASERLFDVSSRGLPMIGDALFFAAERLKWYASLKPEHAKGIDVARAASEAAKWQPFAAAVHRQRPVTSYSGLDPTRPGLEPAPVDVKVSESIELAEWLGDGGAAESGSGGSGAQSPAVDSAPVPSGAR
jgi:hypothetical protein